MTLCTHYDVINLEAFFCCFLITYNSITVNFVVLKKSKGTVIFIGIKNTCELYDSILFHWW